MNDERCDRDRVTAEGAQWLRSEAERASARIAELPPRARPVLAAPYKEPSMADFAHAWLTTPLPASVVCDVYE